MIRINPHEELSLTWNAVFVPKLRPTLTKYYFKKRVSILRSHIMKPSSSAAVNLLLRRRFVLPLVLLHPALLSISDASEFSLLFPDEGGLLLTDSVESRTAGESFSLITSTSEQPPTSFVLVMSWLSKSLDSSEEWSRGVPRPPRGLQFWSLSSRILVAASAFFFSSAQYFLLVLAL